MLLSTLKELSKKGIICGPQEQQQDFFNRAQQRIYLHETYPLWDMDVSGVEIKYSNQGLHVWEAACTYIKPSKVTIQLRKKFTTQTKSFFYNKQEIIQHELVHLIRSEFKEVRFEEVLAYRTSSNKLRSFWGPLFRTPNEALLTLILMALTGVVVLFIPLYALLSFGFVIYLVCRLWNTQRIFSKCIHHLKASCPSQEKMFTFLLHLTDEEIKICATQGAQALYDMLMQGSLRQKQAYEYISSN